MKIKLEEIKKEFTPFSLLLTFENEADLINFKDMLDCVDAELGSLAGFRVADQLLNLIKNK